MNPMPDPVAPWRRPVAADETTSAGKMATADAKIPSITLVTRTADLLQKANMISQLK